MKVIALTIYRVLPKPTVKLCQATDLSSFSRFTRGTIEEFVNFFGEALATNSSLGVRKSVNEKGQTLHIYSRSEGVCGVMITDEEYPARTAHVCLSKLLDDFLTSNPIKSFENLGPSGKIPFRELEEYLVKYQDPKNADSIAKVQAELDATKIEMHKAIELAMERGVKIDKLVEDTEQLTSQSKTFYKTAKKQNSCCAIM